jgi:hypothetical protein
MSEFAFFRFLSNDLLTEEEKAPEMRLKNGVCVQIQENQGV